MPDESFDKKKLEIMGQRNNSLYLLHYKKGLYIPMDGAFWRNYGPLFTRLLPELSVGRGYEYSCLTYSDAVTCSEIF